MQIPTLAGAAQFISVSPKKLKHNTNKRIGQLKIIGIWNNEFEKWSLELRIFRKGFKKNCRKLINKNNKNKSGPKIINCPKKNSITGSIFNKSCLFTFVISAWWMNVGNFCWTFQITFGKKMRIDSKKLSQGFFSKSLLLNSKYRNAENKKKTMEYFVSKPSPTVIPQQNHHKIRSVVTPFIKKYREIVQKNISQASVVANWL